MGSSDLPQGLQVEPGLGSGSPGLGRSSWAISGRAALPAHLAPAPLLLCPQGASRPLLWGVPGPVSAMTSSSSLTHPTSALGEPAVGVLSGPRGRGDEPTRCTDGLMLGRISAAEGPAGAFPLSPVSLSGPESPQCQDLASRCSAAPGHVQTPQRARSLALAHTSPTCSLPHLQEKAALCQGLDQPALLARGCPRPAPVPLLSVAPPAAPLHLPLGLSPRKHRARDRPAPRLLGQSVSGMADPLYPWVSRVPRAFRPARSPGLQGDAPPQKGGRSPCALGGPGTGAFCRLSPGGRGLSRERGWGGQQDGRWRCGQGQGEGGPRNLVCVCCAASVSASVSATVGWARLPRGPPQGPGS